MAAQRSTSRIRKAKSVPQDQRGPASRFPARIREKVRYSDTDRQGHVNNVAFAVFFEAGRVELLFNSGKRLNPKGTEFVAVRADLAFLRPLLWPGEVIVGTRIESIGRSSITLCQAIFQHDQCAATCHSVMVLVSTKAGRPVGLGNAVRHFLERFGKSAQASAATG